MFSAETNEISADLARKHKLGYPIIRDDGLTIARSFGLAFELPAAIKEIYQGFGINLPKNTDYEARRNR